MRRRLIVLGICCWLALGLTASAQEDDSTELAKAAQNPLATLVTLPLQVSKITRFGSQPVNLLLGYYHNSTHPEGRAESQVRIQFNFMFPTKGK